MSKENNANKIATKDSIGAIEKNAAKTCKHKGMFAAIVVASIFVSAIFGAIAGFMASNYANKYSLLENNRALQTGRNDKVAIPFAKSLAIKEESAVIDAVKKVDPAVVSVIVTKVLPKIERFYSDDSGSDFFGMPFNLQLSQERQNGTEKKEIGGGTGFIVSSDGVIVTNKHVVDDEKAEYTVLMNNQKKYEAKVLARDPFNDIAVIKIEEKDLPTVDFGDSSALQTGQIAIAIGNALGEFQNTVSAGVVSGLGRSIVAGGGISGAPEKLSGLIQTDAAINPGNSGGPLLNSSGQVIGINVAIATQAEGIGFAIPINDAKKAINDVIEHGRIIRPYMGIRYMQVTKDLANKNKISVDYGALIVRGETAEDLAVIPGSPADKAGLVENDIILEADGIKLDENSSLSQIVQDHSVGDEISLKILHRGEEKTIKVKLEEAK
ncbi:MAG: trypsin-like peptidase domain-containing protein [Minisyncoccia bacterium]